MEPIVAKSIIAPSLSTLAVLLGLVWNKMSHKEPPPTALTEPPKIAVVPPPADLAPPKVDAKPDDKPGTTTPDGKSEPGKPSDPGKIDTKPADGKPGDTKPADGKPADLKPGDAKPGEVKGPDGKLIDPKTGKPIETKLDAKNSGTVFIDVKPWGTVLVNGRSRGNSPPVKDFKLPPGKYKIEIKNADNFVPHVENIELKAGDTVRIKHEFK